MLSAERLPASVIHTVETYLNLLGRRRGGFSAWPYLVGSVALDDYKEGSSDIDFVTLVSGSTDATCLGQLERAHFELISLSFVGRWRVIKPFARGLAEGARM